MSFARKTLSAVALLALAHVAPRAQSAATPEHSLRITAEVVERDYCAGQGGVDFLHMRLRLRYSNAGTQRLIVYRGGNLFYQVLVGSGGGRQGGAPRLELRTTSARYATREPEPVDAPRPGGDFVTLAPGDEFKTEVPATLPVTRGATAASVPNTIGAGEHTLRLLVSTWYESKPLGERLRERWARAGHLWTQPVSTGPLPFSTETASAGPTRPCPGTTASAAKDHND